MLKVENYGAACAKINGEWLSILTDPWLDGHIYLGTWERETPLANPVKTIGPVDYIYISHIHEDHLHPESLRSYTSAHPEAQVWIGEHCKHLVRMTQEFHPVVTSSVSGGSCQAWTIANRGPEAQGIDSVLVVRDAESAVIDLNDNQWNEALANDICALTKNRHVTALIPFTGDGPYPQCFDGLTHMEKYQAAEAKKAKFLAQFLQWKTALHADIAVPFSAGYRLRGPLAELNCYRGIPKPEDVPGGTVLKITGAADVPPTDSSGYVWEDAPMPSNERLEQLLTQAQARSPKVDGPPLTVDLDWGTGAAYVDCTYAPASAAYETIRIDPRLLEGMLTKRWNANTLEIGSCVKIQRHSETYDPRAWIYLTRFHV